MRFTIHVSFRLSNDFPSLTSPVIFRSSVPAPLATLASSGELQYDPQGLTEPRLVDTHKHASQPG